MRLQAQFRNELFGSAGCIAADVTQRSAWEQDHNLVAAIHWVCLCSVAYDLPFLNNLELHPVNRVLTVPLASLGS
jgi:hypothetical protein